MFKVNQQDELKLLMKDGKYDLIGRTETWLELKSAVSSKSTGTKEQEELHCMLRVCVKIQAN